MERPRMNNVEQHIIPRGYLNAWADPALPTGRIGWIHVITKTDTTNTEFRSPKTYFREKDRYTTYSGKQRVLDAENRLAETEQRFGKVMCALKAGQPINAGEQEYLTSFVAAMRARTKRFAERAGTMARGLRFQGLRLVATDAPVSALVEEAEDELRRINADSVLIGSVEIAATLRSMSLTVFTTSEPSGFVTGDEPCCLCVPGAPSANFNDPNVELTLPLSPEHLAVYSRKEPAPMYERLDAERTANFNRRTISHCQDEFVSWRGVVLPEWFDRDRSGP